MVNNLEKDKKQKKVIFYKEKSIKKTDYVLVVTHYMCEGCNLWHNIKKTHLISIPKLLRFFEKLGFSHMGKTDFFLKYEIEKGYKKEFDSTAPYINFDEEETEHFRQNFKYVVYSANK